MEHGRPRASAPGEARHEQLGGARAEFVANLGRRVAALRAVVERVDQEPDALRLREDLQRRLHALGAGARLLRFVRLAERIAEGEAELEAVAGAATPAAVVASLRALLAELPALAWGQAAGSEKAQAAAASAREPSSAAGRVETPTATPEPGSVAAGQSATWLAAVDHGQSLTFSQTPPPVVVRKAEDARVAPPADPPPPAAPTQRALPFEESQIEALTVLVVGAEPLAEALDAGISDVGPRFEVERTEDVALAIDLARALAPDVVVLDADLPGARTLAELFAADPLTEPVPVIVLGGFTKPDEAAPYVALGAARALGKPVSPDALRRAVADAAATYVRREVAREPLGEVTLDQLGARLAEELRRGLCDAAEAKGRGVQVDLGDGAEVLAALWGAVARIRDLVTIRSRGGVRFTPNGPEGALALTPWLAPPGAVEGARARERSEIRNVGPARSAALEPHDASLKEMGIVVADDDPAVTWFLAGVLRAAGATVHEAHDGARALDLAFEMTPDLVVSDVLMPHLDGFALCRELKRDVALRDVPVILLSWKEDLLQRLRELGADADGYLRKEASAAAFVQRVHEVMRGRRRVVERIAAGGEVRGRLDGMTSRTLLSMVCAHRPNSTVSVRDAAFLYEVQIREGRPASATRTASDGRFLRGTSVIAALLGVGSGRFAVTTVPGGEGRTPHRPGFEGTLAEQLLPMVAAARAAQRLLNGPALLQADRVDLDSERISAYADATPEPTRSLLRSLMNGASPRALVTSGEVGAVVIEDLLCDAAARGGVLRVLDGSGEDLLAPAVVREMNTLRGVRRAPPRPAVEAPAPELWSDGPASSQDELAGDELQNQVTAVPGSVAPVWSSKSAAGEGADATEDYEVDLLDESEAIPLVTPRSEEIGDAPDDVVSACATWTTPGEVSISVTPLGPAVVPMPRGVEPAALPALDMPKHLLSLGTLSPPPVAEQHPAIAVVAPAPVLASAPAAPVEASSVNQPAPRVREEEEESPQPPRRMRRPSAYAPEPQPAARDNRMTMWVLFAIAAFVFAVGARLSRDHQLQSAPPPAPPSPPAVAPSAAAPEQPETAVAPGPIGESAANPIVPEDLPLPATDKVSDGQGMIEIIAGASDALFVDGRSVGTGTVKLSLAPKTSAVEIRAKLRDEERVRFALVKAGRLTRVRIAPPWRR